MQRERGGLEFPKDPRPAVRPSTSSSVSKRCNPSIPSPPTPPAASALSEVSEALGGREGVGLQGEEVLLGQEEAAAVALGRRVELQLGVRGGVLQTPGHGRCWGGNVGGRR